MAYYDPIAKQWHQITGYKGGAFKAYILNDLLLAAIPDIAGKTILEIGCGNGYFMPMMLRHFSSQSPEKIIITDISKAQLKNAARYFKVENADYLKLDVYKKFPAEISEVNIIISSMVYNEVSNKGLWNAVRESTRVLRDDGSIITAVLHPAFIKKQTERGVVKKIGNQLVMTGNSGLKLPVVNRAIETYQACFIENRLEFEATEIFGNEKLFNEKPALKAIKDTPIGLLLQSRKTNL